MKLIKAIIKPEKLDAVSLANSIAAFPSSFNKRKPLLNESINPI